MDVGRSVCYTGTRGILNMLPRGIVCDRRVGRTA